MILGPIAPPARLPPRAEPLARAMHGSSYMLMIILLVLLFLALAGGCIGHSNYGYAGWSPAGVILVVLLVLFFTGHRFG